MDQDETQTAYQKLTEVDEGLHHEALYEARGRSTRAAWARWARGELANYMTIKELDAVDWDKLREMLKSPE
ncbi:hypothetical protein AB0M00_31370 [Streptomyces chartreusis]|uniref:hypothetical protein n=1 Tax=Streptomyces chartreusis TaxID=1969 RepID=UPI0034405DD2